MTVHLSPPNGANNLDLLLSVHAILLPLWLLAGLVLYYTLGWFYGPEAAARWNGRRRVRLLAWAFGLGVATIIVVVFLAEPTTFLQKLFYLDPSMAFVPLFDTTSSAAFDSFYRHVSSFGLLEASVALTVLMAVKLGEKWLDDRTSPAERQCGLAGVTAWLAWPNRLWAAAWVIGVTAFTATVADGDTNTTATAFVGSTLLAVAAMLAYPVARTLRNRGTVAATDTFRNGSGPSPTDLTPERQRVLRLLEDGRITADEASDLLAALVATNAAPPPVGAWPAGAFDGPHKLVLIGAAVLLVGFFLPWFRVAPFEELRRLGSAFSPDLFGPAAAGLSGNVVTEPAGPQIIVTVAGGDVGHGLGWLVLACGLITAALPAINGLTPAARRQAAWLTASVGSLVALYLLSSGTRYASFGLALVLAAQAVQWFGLLLGVPRRTARTPMPVAA